MQLVKQSDLTASRSGSASEGCMKIVQRLMNETADQPLTETTLANAPPCGEGVLACVATKDRKSMNHLLSGTALAAALADRRAGLGANNCADDARISRSGSCRAG
jgi:hypothetical protein